MYFIIIKFYNFRIIMKKFLILIPIMTASLFSVLQASQSGRISPQMQQFAGNLQQTSYADLNRLQQQATNLQAQSQMFKRASSPDSNLLSRQDIENRCLNECRNEISLKTGDRIGAIDTNQVQNDYTACCRKIKGQYQYIPQINRFEPRPNPAQN
jgi:hypothetical protein